MKDNKLVEKYDDNPGSYFGMLVEGWEELNESRRIEYLELDLAEKSGDKDIYDAYDENELTIVKDRDTWYFEHCPKGLDKKVRVLMKKYYPELNYLYDEYLKEDYVTDLVGEILSKKVDQPKRGFKWLSNNGTSGEVEYKGQKFTFRKLPNGDYKVMRSSDAGWNWSETLFKDESLKEDKFVPQDKMSKKAQKELNDKKRGTWGNTNPVTRVQPNKKAYDRKRDKKIKDESLKENFNIELKDYKKDEDVKDGYTFNFIVNGHPVSMGCWTEDLGDGEYGDFIVDFDDYSQLDFISEDELDDLWEKLGDIIETKVLKNESLEESKLNESSDGWNEDKLYDIKYILDKLENLNYEINNCVRGAYSYCKTYEELGHYISDLGEKLADLGSDISLIDEEEDDEFED